MLQILIRWCQLFPSTVDKTRGGTEGRGMSIDDQRDIKVKRRESNEGGTEVGSQAEGLVPTKQERDDIRGNFPQVLVPPVLCPCLPSLPVLML